MAKTIAQQDDAGALASGDFLPVWQVGPGQQRKVTLANLAAFLGAGGYTLPMASVSVLGGVKVGAGLSIDGTGVLSANSYSLPIAAAGTLGGIKVGSGLAIAGDGTLSVSYSYTLPVATASVLGGVKIGAGLSVAGDGTVSLAAATVVTESGTARTATPAHANNYTRFTNAGAKTYTFDAAQSYPVGSEYHGRNMGTGNITLTAAGGMVLNAPNGGSLVVPINGAFTVKIVGAAEADVIGVTVAA